MTAQYRAWLVMLLHGYKRSRHASILLDCPQLLRNLTAFENLIFKPFPPFPHTQHVRIVEITGPRLSPGTKQQESFHSDFPVQAPGLVICTILLATECLPAGGRHF